MDASNERCTNLSQVQDGALGSGQENWRVTTIVVSDTTARTLRTQAPGRSSAFAWATQQTRFLRPIY